MKKKFAYVVCGRWGIPVSVWMTRRAAKKHAIIDRVTDKYYAVMRVPLSRSHR